METLLRNRNFVLLWLAQIVSGMGDVLYNVGVMVTIFERTGSALQTGGVLVATTLPPFLLGPVAGVLVDRYPRRSMMIAMDLLRAGLVALLLLFIQREGFSVWGIYLIVAGLASATTFYTPARLALLPTLVPRPSLVRANSLIMSTNQATFGAGYALGGILVLRLGFEPLITIDLFTFLAAALLVSLIALPPDRERAPHSQATQLPWHAIGSALRYLRENPLPRSLLLMEVFEYVPHGLWTSALMLVFVKEALGGTANDWGYQNAAFYGGQLVGAVIAAVVAARLAHRPGWVIIGNAFFFSLLTLSYALSPSVSFAILLCFVFGPTSAMRDVVQDALLQANVAQEVMGRVYALRGMFTNLSFMVAGILFAWGRTTCRCAGSTCSGACSTWAPRSSPSPAPRSAIATCGRRG